RGGGCGGLMPGCPRGSNRSRPIRKAAAAARSETQPARVDKTPRHLRDVTARMSEPALPPPSVYLAPATIGPELFWLVFVFRPARQPVAKPTWPRPDRRAAYWSAHSRAVVKRRRYG